MRRELIILVAFFIFVSSVYALCDESQIDINSASAEELQTFTGIGETKALAIIDYREQKEFESVEELIEVKGIGPVTLKNMKEEGACVETETETSESPKVGDEEPIIEDSEESISSNNTLENTNINYISGDSITHNSPKENITKEVIILNSRSKDINTDKSVEKISKNNFPLYGLLGLGILVGGLLFAKNKKEKLRNEFR